MPTEAIPPQAEQSTPERRRFFQKLIVVVASSVAVLTPLAGGIAMVVGRLGRKRATQMVRITSLEAIPTTGEPRRFPVISERTDAWSKHPPTAIGSVYLRREGPEGEVTAFTSVCPHLGCAVNFQDRNGHFQCPCHNSAWTPDGERIDPAHSPSPRDLDTLPVEIKDGDVWVEYQRFRSGTTEKELA